LVLGLASAAEAAPSSCGDISAKYPSLKGRTLAIGYNTSEANYTAVDPKDPDKIVGIEPALIEAASQCLGFKYTLQGMDFAGLIPALQSGRVQVIMGGMYASDERAKQINFVKYMKAAEAMLVQAGNPKGLKDFDSTCGVIAAEIVGTVENDILAKQSAACTAAGKEPITPLSFPSNDRAFQAVAGKRADIMMTDAGVAGYLAETASNVVQVGYAVPSDFAFGMGIKKDDPDLMNGLEAVYHAMYQDGSLLQEMNKWGFTEAQQLEPVIKTE
jgi:polar amino acid transport system substrate-binding protein